MPIDLATGLPGVSMNIGDHICAFYRGQDERDQVIIPYLRAGLDAGDRCICVLDSTDPDGMHDALPGDPEQLSLHRSEDSYLHGGSFSPDEMLRFWETAASEAFMDGVYPFLRAAGEMTWALRDVPGVSQLISYEAQLNRFLPRYPQVVLCLYDLEQFTDGEILLDVLKTHPKVLMSSMVFDNPWFIEPDEFLARNL